MARRRTKSREIDPANRSAKHPCKTAIQLLPHGSTKRSIKRAIPHNATGNSGMTGNTDIPRCCPFGSGSRASVSRVWRVAARAHRTHTTVIHSSNRTERISASPCRRTCFYADQPKPCRPHQCSLSRKIAMTRDAMICACASRSINGLGDRLFRPNTASLRRWEFNEDVVLSNVSYLTKLTNVCG
jgi:hypothetical protein